MATQLNDTQKGELRNVLRHPLLRMALEEALNEVARKKRGAVSLEEAAMAYNHQCGAFDVVDCLFSMADEKKEFVVGPRKLRHTN